MQLHFHHRNQAVAMTILLIVGIAITGCDGGSSKTIDVPVLVLSGQGGDVATITITVHRDRGSQGPLIVSVAEDAAGGSGEVLRASLWQACTVAALHRHDDLAGVKVEAKVTGYLDGPSTGGMLTVALLSVLEERDLPSDFAFTGTVMPDGTIGRVGGLPQKMQAAAKKGFKRILVPAFVRFEPDPQTGKEVDIKRLAESLGMEFVAVSNVDEAYRAIHKLADTTSAPPSESVLDLDASIEELLKVDYSSAMAEGDRLYQAIPQAERLQIESDASLRQFLLSNRVKAETAFRSGKLLAAQTYSQGWSTIMKARAANVRFFQSAKQGSHADMIKLADKRIGEHLSSLPGFLPLIDDAAKDFPVVGTQFVAGAFDSYGVGGVLLLFEGRLIAARTEAAKSGGNQEALRQLEIDMKGMQMLLSNATTDYMKSFLDDTRRFALLLPSMSLRRDPKRIEALFHQAHTTAANTFERSTVPAVASGFGLSPDQAIIGMRDNDMSLVMYGPSSQLAILMHEAFQADQTTGSPFALAVGAQVHSSCFTTIAGIITRWEELDVEVPEEGSLRYHRTDLLNHLIRSARANALISIAECKRLGIPCVQPIYHFQVADLDRDDNEQDKVDVLTSYWQASIQAKVLILLFGGQ